jgi:lipoprotein-anchoring transpeptidase ErfK/SrfK
MFHTEEQVRKLAALTGVMVMAAAEAMAQERGTGSPRRIVVSIPDRKLALIESGKVVKIYRTAVGAPRTPSPTGSFTIQQRIPDPTWYTKGRIVPPGKTNPLGTRWMGLSRKGYGIHGTSNPASIGKNASHGCIRMRNRDVEELFEMVAVGDTVELYGERTAEIEALFGAPAQPVTVQVAAARTAAPAATEAAGEGQ